MRRLGVARAIGPPPPEPWEQISHRSPDGEWTLRFHDVDEFAMGATFWEVELEHRGGRRRRLPRAMGVMGIEPFSADSRYVAYQAVTFGGSSWPPPRRLYLAEVTGRRIRTPRLRAPLWSVQWSPRTLELLVLSEGTVYVLDEAGRRRARARTPAERGPIIGWLPSGDEFFIVGRRDDASPTTISFHSAADGAVVERCPLDPSDLVPYDSAPYESVRRDAFSLEAGAGATGVGSLLDEWSDARYDAATGTLQLAVLRPVGPPRAKRGRRGTDATVSVEERWIALTLGSSDRDGVLKQRMSG